MSKIICRCEEITEEDILNAIKDGATTVDEIKKFTRAGMGLCQGRTCRKTVERILAKKLRKSVENIRTSSYRMPVRPVKMKVMERRKLVDLGRIITAMVTPFDKELNVDYNQAVKLAKKLENEGSSALLINGTTGESPTLNSDEVYKLISEVKKYVNIPIMAGVGTNCTRKTIENIKNIESLEVDGLLVIVPYYNKPNQQSIYEHFRTIAENTDLPIMIYNVPGRTGVNIEVNIVNKLSKIHNIVAIKEASGDVAQITRMINETPDDFLVYTGDDILTLPSISAGAYGVVSVASNIAGKKIKRMIDSYLVGNISEASKINLELTKLYDALFITTNPIPVKIALNLKGFNVGSYRLPLTNPSQDVVNIIKESISIV